MLNYTVRLDVRNTRQEEWEAYMMEHIRKVLNTGHFVGVEFKKFDVDLDPLLLGGPVDLGFARYVVEYLCTSKEEFDKYESNGAAALRSDHEQQFGKDVVSKRFLTNYSNVIADLLYKSSTGSESAQ